MIFEGAVQRAASFLLQYTIAALGKVIAEGSQGVRGCGHPPRIQGRLVETGRGGPSGGGNVGEAHQPMPHRQLARVIELQAGDSFAAGQCRRLGYSPQWSAVEEDFQDVLSPVVVVVDDLYY